MRGRYLMVLPVPAYRAGPGRFETEAAFAEHLRLLRRALGPIASTLVLAGPEYSAAQYGALQGRLARIEEEADGIYFRPMYAEGLTRARFFAELPRIWTKLYREVELADVVHAGASPLFRPFELPALLMARSLGKKTVAVTDIDQRQSARMNLEAGTWSRRVYWTTRLIHDRYTHWQHVLGARWWSLMLLKGRKLADDYGRGRSNVHYFLNSAFTADQVIDDERLERKVARLQEPGSELGLTYFGRLVPYKGIDYMLQAVRTALDLGARVRFDVIGGGPELPALRELSRRLALEAHVHFVGPVPYGPALFERLYELDVQLAAPLREDTPRSALDATAAGQALVAFDTYYYRELSGAGAPIELVPWRDARAMAECIARLDANRAELGRRLRASLRFARDNTQEAWLERRAGWTRELFATEGASGPQPSSGAD